MSFPSHNYDLQQVGGFLRVLQFPPIIKLTSTIPGYNLNIVESGIKHNKPTKLCKTILNLRSILKSQFL